MKRATLTERASLALDAYIVDFAWSPDSRSLAVAGGEGAVMLVDDVASAPKARAPVIFWAMTCFPWVELR